MDANQFFQPDDLQTESDWMQLLNFDEDRTPSESALVTLEDLEQKMRDMNAKKMALGAELEIQEAIIKTNKEIIKADKDTIKANREAIEEANRILQKRQSGISQATAILHELREDFEKEKSKIIAAKEAHSASQALQCQSLALQQSLVPQQPVGPQQPGEASQLITPPTLDFQAEMLPDWDVGQFSDAVQFGDASQFSDHMPFLTPDYFSHQQPIQDLGFTSQPSAIDLAGVDQANQAMQPQPRPDQLAAKRKREETEETDGVPRAPRKHKKPRAPRKKPGPRKFEAS